MKKKKQYLIGNQFAKGNKANKTSFKKGHTPWNKGKKYSKKEKEKLDLSGLEEGRLGCKIGTKTIRVRRNGRKRRFIKREDGSWEEYAKYFWKQKYGSLKKNDVVHHINGDTLDDRIENLIALPRKDHPIFHNRWGLKEMSEEQIEFYRDRYRSNYCGG